ncbi:g9969 [Coccomyxa elongata]
MLGWLLLLLLQAVVLAETWLRAQVTGARQHFQQVFISLLDTVPFPFNLLIDCVIPRHKQTRGRAPAPPKNIALVLAETSFSKSSIRQLADVISWCAQTGLTHITVYDPRGHFKAQQHTLACSLSNDGQSAAAEAFTIQAGYPMLNRDIMAVPEKQSMGLVSRGMANEDSESTRSLAPDHCSISLLNTSVDIFATKSQPANESASAVRLQYAGHTVEVTLLSAEDAHAPLVAAARSGTSMGVSRQVAAHITGKQTEPKRPNGSQFSPPVSGLGSAGVSSQGAAADTAVQSRAPCDAWAGYSPPARLAAAVAVAKAESSGDLMGFLSMLAAGQTAGESAPQARAPDGSSFPSNGACNQGTPLNGWDGAASDASTSSFTIGDSTGPLSRSGLSEGALNRLGASGGVLRSSSLDVFDGGAEQARAMLLANGAAECDSSMSNGEDWVAKKGSLRWIRQRGAAAQADGGGPIRRRARRGSRMRGDMGYALLRSPWSWGDPADVSVSSRPDEDVLSRTHSNGGLSHNSDLALGRSSSEQWLAEHDRGQADGEGWTIGRSSSVEKASKDKWFLSGGQSTEDLLSAFTKDLEAADEPQPQLTTAPRAIFDGARQLLTPADLDAQIARLAGDAAVREPDLILVFGKTFTLAGYPPWPIRFSEIYHMGELATFSRADFCDALRRYCKTSQRFGT